MNKNIYVRLIPFGILLIMLLYTWVSILTTDYSATLRHQAAMGLFLLNIALYFINFNWAVGLTGIVLMLATFNALALLPDVVYSSYYFRIGGTEISTPSIQLSSLAVLLIYIIVDYKQIKEVFRLILK